MTYRDCEYMEAKNNKSSFLIIHTLGSAEKQAKLYICMLIYAGTSKNAHEKAWKETHQASTESSVTGRGRR